MTSVSKLADFLIKVLPDGGVYSSEEAPPKGATILYTDAKTPYWIRDPDELVSEDKVTDAANELISEATADYNAHYNKLFVDMQEDFETRLKDPESKEYRQMRNLVRILLYDDYDDEDPDIGTPEKLLQHLGLEEGNKQGTLQFSAEAGFVADGDISDGSKIQNMNPNVKFRILQALMGSRYPGNNGVEIPTHHFRAIPKLVANGNRMYQVSTSTMQKLYTHVMALDKSDGYKPKVLAMLKREVKKFKHVTKTGKLSTKFKWSGEVTNAALAALIPTVGGYIGAETYGQCTSKMLVTKNDEGYNVFPEHPDGSSIREVLSIDLFDCANVHNPDKPPHNQRGSTTVLHEMAHAVHQHLPREIKTQILHEYVRALDENAGFVSAYSKQGGIDAEFFAESYLAYVAHTDLFKKRNPTMFELMKKVFASKPRYTSKDDFDTAQDFWQWRGEDNKKMNEIHQRLMVHQKKGTHTQKMNEQPFYPQDARKAILNQVLPENNKDEDDDIKNTFDVVRDGLSAQDIEEKMAAGHEVKFTDNKDIVGIIVPKGRDLPPEDDDDDDIEKSWYTNPRGDKDPHGKPIRKEGDGGGFGDGGGVAFTSTDAGIFTPTHSERERKPKKEKRTGVHRLADFLTDNSPERKMEKGDTTITNLVDLLNWVKMEMRKDDKKHFRQQTSGETINNQPPRIDWAKGNKEMPREDGVSEFDGKPNANAAISQKDEERRIRRLGTADDKTDNTPASTGHDIRLRWESGGYESDALHSGSSKDKEQGDVEDPEDKHIDNPFDEEDFESKNTTAFEKLLKEIEES